MIGQLHSGHRSHRLGRARTRLLSPRDPRPSPRGRAADLHPLFDMMRVRGEDPRQDVSHARVHEVVARASGEFPAVPPGPW